jgi:hypothetical protein
MENFYRTLLPKSTFFEGGLKSALSGVLPVEGIFVLGGFGNGFQIPRAAANRNAPQDSLKV